LGSYWAILKDTRGGFQITFPFLPIFLHLSSCLIIWLELIVLDAGGKAAGILYVS
jgi:hypothetical protein